MLSINLQARIFRDYHAGKEYTNGRKFRYSLQYNPLSAMHTWIIKQDKSSGEWYFLHPLVSNMQFTPRTSKHKEA